MRYLFAFVMVVLVSSVACEPAPPTNTVQTPPVDNPPMVVETPPAVVEPPVDQVVVNPPTNGSQNNLPGQGPIDSGVPIDDGGEEVIN